MSRRQSPESNTQRVIPRDFNAAERVILALSLRRQRLTYTEIALRCGYANKGAARNAIIRELRRRVVVGVDEYREQELEILDAIHQKIWPLVMAPGTTPPMELPDLLAADRLLALSQARRQLLNLDVQPEEEQTQQNYTKRIILTHIVEEISG